LALPIAHRERGCVQSTSRSTLKILRIRRIPGDLSCEAAALVPHEAGAQPRSKPGSPETKPNRALDRRGKLKEDGSAELNDGGALVSTWGTRQRRHAEDGSLAS